MNATTNTAVEPSIDPGVHNGGSSPGADGKRPAGADAQRREALERLMVPRSEIVIEEGFNPRRDFTGDAGLNKSIREQGVLVPLLVRRREDGLLALVDGERRLRGSDAAGFDQVPVVSTAGDLTQALETALITGTAGKSLNPVEEAFGYKRLLDAGRSRRYLERKVAKSARYLTARLRILDVPEAAHPGIADGTIALSHVPALAEMAAVSPKLAELVAAHAPARVDAEAAMEVVMARQGEHDLWPARRVDVSTLDLDAEAQEKVATVSEWGPWGPAFAVEDLDRARAAGVLYCEHDERGYGAAVFCDREVFTDIVLQVLDRKVASRQKAHEREAENEARRAASQSEEKAERLETRNRVRRLSAQSRGANLDLGVRLAQKVKVEKLEKAFVELCAYTILGEYSSAGAYPVDELAGAGLRLVLEEWQSVETLKNGKPKVHYLGDGKDAHAAGTELRKWFWDWFEKARTAEEMAKRLVIALAAAEYAVAEALPMSRRTRSPLRPGRNDKARAALMRLTRGVVPPTVKQVRHELENHDEPDAPTDTGSDVHDVEEAAA